MTALEVVEYLAWMRGLGVKESRARARESLDAVGLSARAASKIRELSGGMVRRVALAQAIAAAPRVLLLDEPSTGLDPRQRRIMVDLILSLGSCVLLSSHVMEDVRDVAQRVLLLNEGRLIFDGTTAALSAQAPTGTPPARAAEAGFLQTLSDDRAEPS